MGPARNQQPEHVHPCGCPCLSSQHLPATGRCLSALSVVPMTLTTVSLIGGPLPVHATGSLCGL